MKIIKNHVTSKHHPAPASGDNVINELSPEASLLLNLCWKVCDKAEFQPKDGKTFCNLSVQEIGRSYGVEYLHGLMANDIHLYLSNSMRWGKVTGQQAQESANRGKLVISAWLNLDGGSGHCAVVCPGVMEHSPSWGKDVPLVANVGLTNGVMRASEAYREEPEYFTIMTPSMSAN